MSGDGSYQEILQVIADVQDALPQRSKHNRAPISISPTINVKFPTQESSLSRFHHGAHQEVLSSPTILGHYWQACQRSQSTISQGYLEVISNLESLKEFGGASDLSLQSHVADEMSRLYEKWEMRLVTSLIERYSKPIPSPREHAQLEKKEAIHILRRAFAVNTSPTDAERDYLAKQTGMTYRQVTVWFQNNRSRKINPIPKRSRQKSSQNDTKHGLASPPQTGSTISSLHSIDQQLRTSTDSPLAQHVLVPPSSSSEVQNPHHTLRIPTPPFESLQAGEEDNSKLRIVSRSVSGIAEGGLAGGLRDGEVEQRKIKPLRKTRLAGKKATVNSDSKLQDATIIQKTGHGSESRQPPAVATTKPLQQSPSDTLNRTKDQSRVSSTSSIPTVDNLLDDPSRQLFRSRNGSVLALPLSILNNGRTVSGSSAGEVDASLGPEDILRAGTEGMIPMFNFHPPTPSNAGFNPSTNHNATYAQAICETPLQFEPIDFGPLFRSGAGDADKAAEGLLRDLDELDFGAFLNEEGSSAEGSPEVAQDRFQSREETRETGAGAEVDGGRDGRAPTVDPAQIEYIFEKMDAQNKAGDGMDIDPAIFEMLKGILTGSTATNALVGYSLDQMENSNIPPPPNSTPIIDDPTSEFTGRPLSEYDPSLSALAIDLSALMNPSSNRGSICIQTTPSDVSEMTAFEDFEGDDVVPVAERPDVRILGTEVGRGLEGEGKVDWAGLLDFGDMFEAFWKMADRGEGEGSAGQSL